MTELTFAFLKYGFLLVLWVFAWLAVRSLRKDIQSFSPTTSRARRKRAKAANRNAARAQRSSARAQASNATSQDEGPTLLVVIDGPTAGVSIPLSHQAITLGRAASNTMVLKMNSCLRIMLAFSRIRRAEPGLSRIWAAPMARSWTGSA